MLILLTIAALFLAFSLAVAAGAAATLRNILLSWVGTLPMAAGFA